MSLLKKTRRYSVFYFLASLCFTLPLKAQVFSKELLQELLQYQGSPQFVYRHKWQPNMLVMWDNRSVLHKATGGYDGYDRLLHRTTISQFD